MWWWRRKKKKDHGRAATGITVDPPCTPPSVTYEYAQLAFYVSRFYSVAVITRDSDFGNFP